MSKININLTTKTNTHFASGDGVSSSVGAGEDKFRVGSHTKNQTKSSNTSNFYHTQKIIVIRKDIR